MASGEAMARFDGGWIKIHRQILEHPVSHRGLFTFGVFVRLLYMANWKVSSVIFGGKKITLQPGQLVTGLRELSPDKDEDPYLNRVRASLDYLVLCEAIEQVSNNQGRLITVCNWAKYQSDNSDGLTISTGEEQAENKQRTSKPQLSEEDKKERKNNWFESALAEYKKFPNVTKGAKAEDRFADQIRNEETFQTLLGALKNYSAYLGRKENDWRKPKTSFENFLGTKRSGFFWREFISPVSSGEQAQASMTLGTLADLTGGQANAS